MQNLLKDVGSNTQDVKYALVQSHNTQVIKNAFKDESSKNGIPLSIIPPGIGPYSIVFLASDTTDAKIKETLKNLQLFTFFSGDLTPARFTVDECEIDRTRSCVKINLI